MAAVSVDSTSVARVLGAIVALLVTLNLLAYATGTGRATFLLDAEQNIPTYFSTVILVASAGLLAVIAILKRGAHDRYRLHWAALSVVFLYLSADELASLHEASTPRVEYLVGETGGAFHYASTIFTATMVLLVVLTFARFFLHLTPRFRLLFGVAGALYVGGALGLEMVGGAWDQRHGAENLEYFLITTLEETMEMTGVTIFIYGLLEYLRTEFADASLRFGARA